MAQVEIELQLTDQQDVLKARTKQRTSLLRVTNIGTLEQPLWGLTTEGADTGKAIVPADKLFWLLQGRDDKNVIDEYDYYMRNADGTWSKVGPR